MARRCHMSMLMTSAGVQIVVAGSYHMSMLMMLAGVEIVVVKNYHVSTMMTSAGFTKSKGPKLYIGDISKREGESLSSFVILAQGFTLMM